LFDELSAGIILTTAGRNADHSEVLLLRHTAGHWDFPKGNIELGETEIEAATRELREETGVSHFRLLPNFKRTITYYYRRNHKPIFKKVTLFLGTTDERNIILSNEHVDYRWKYLDQSSDLLKYKNSQISLEYVKNFLKNEFTPNIYY
jgi:bis(5'-nucleosidyl)-tetraphosphatase